MGDCGGSDEDKKTMQSEGICSQMRLELFGIFKGDKEEIKAPSIFQEKPQQKHTDRTILDHH